MNTLTTESRPAQSLFIAHLARRPVLWWASIAWLIAVQAVFYWQLLTRHGDRVLPLISRILEMVR